MYQGMKSVMVFDANDNKTETERKWQEWNHHKNDVAMENLLKLEELKEN